MNKKIDMASSRWRKGGGMKIELLQCPHGMEALGIGNTRITSYKHCGRWNTIKSFEINGVDTIRVIEEEMENIELAMVKEGADDDK